MFPLPFVLSVSFVSFFLFLFSFFSSSWALSLLVWRYCQQTFLFTEQTQQVVCCLAWFFAYTLFVVQQRCKWKTRCLLRDSLSSRLHALFGATTSRSEQRISRRPTNLQCLSQRYKWVTILVLIYYSTQHMVTSRQDLLDQRPIRAAAWGDCGLEERDWTQSYNTPFVYFDHCWTENEEWAIRPVLHKVTKASLLGSVRKMSPKSVPCVSIFCCCLCWPCSCISLYISDV